jgi:hypothetical protein
MSYIGSPVLVADPGPLGHGGSGRDAGQVAGHRIGLHAGRDGGLPALRAAPLRAWPIICAGPAWPRGRRLGLCPGAGGGDGGRRAVGAGDDAPSHPKIIARALTGADTGWPQHGQGRQPWGALLRFHAPETLIGLGLLAAMPFGLISLWALPVALGLIAAVPLSALTGGRGDWLPAVATGRLD